MDSVFRSVIGLECSHGMINPRDHAGDSFHIVTVEPF